MMNFTMKSKLNAKRSVGAFELTMRGLAGWLLMLAAVGGLTACSSGSDGDPLPPLGQGFGLGANVAYVTTNCTLSSSDADDECVSKVDPVTDDDEGPPDPLITYTICAGTGTLPDWCKSDFVATFSQAPDSPRDTALTVRGGLPGTATFAAVRSGAALTTAVTNIEAEFEYSGGRAENGQTVILHQLPLIKAAYAYARDATGAGVTITIVDSGINPFHREFAKSDGTEDDTKLKVRDLDAFGQYDPTGSNTLHGTAVASVAAGKRDGGKDGWWRYMHGVAYDANIDFLTLRLDPNDGSLLSPTSANDLTYASLFHGILDLADGDIINFSWGPSSDTIGDTLHANVRSQWASTAAVLAQKGVTNKKIIVWAAGNDGALSPHLLAGLGVDFPELQSHILAVVGVDKDGNIHADSNRCGVAKNFCLAAPGWDMVAAYYNGPDQYAYNYGGTSLAAAMVSGSLAVLKQFFADQLSNTELVNRLLATANRKDQYADSDIYGQGMLDLDAATRPKGELVSSTVSDSKPLHQTGFALNGGAFGESFAQLDDIQIAGFDELGAPFFMPASAVITPAARDKTPTPDKVSAQLPEGGGELALRIGADNIPQSGYLSASGWMVGYGENPGQFFNLSDKRDNPLRDSVAGAFNFSEGDRSHLAKTDFGFNRIGFGNQDAFVSPYLALAQNGASLGWRHDNGRFGIAVMHGNAQFDQWQNPGGERGLGILMDWTTQTKRGAIAIQAGAVREPESMLGARANDYDLQAQTAFAGVNYARAFGNWDALATAYFGATRADLNNEFWQADGDIKSSAYALGFTRESLRRHNDKLALRITQPLRAERAKAIMNLPIGRTKAGEVVRHDQQVDFAPHGRTIQLEAAYQLPLTTKNTLHTALGIEREPLHDETLDDNWYARVAFVKGF